MIDFQRVFQASAEPRLLLDTAGTVIAASDGYVRAVALERNQIIGRALSSQRPYAGSPTALAMLNTIIDTVARTGIAHSHDLNDLQPADSGLGWREAGTQPVLDDAGNVLLLVHVLREAAPIEGPETRRERRLRKLLEYSSDLLILFDVSGRAVFVSPSVEQVLGYEPLEYANAPPVALVHPDDAPAFGRAVQSVLANAGNSVRTRARMRHRDGSFRTLEISSSNLLHDPDVAAVVSSSRDVTPDVERVEQLRRSRDQLQVALAAARAIGWEHDLRSDTGMYSSDVSEFFGLPREALAGAGIRAVAPHADLEQIKRALERALESGEDFRTEFRGPDQQGAPQFYACHGQVVRDEKGEPLRLVGVTWNITDQKKLQEERLLLEQRIQESQKLESLGVLAGGIAHDFNNILMAILGNADLARMEVIEKCAAHEHLLQIEQAARRASELCRQMLAYAGKGRFVLEQTHLNQLIEETVHLLQVSISKKAVLRLDLREGLPEVIADATQLRQVLMNLVINASDAIGDRSGVISISTGQVSVDRSYLQKTVLAPEIPEGDYVYVEVSDTGAGMTPEVQARIFEPFFSTKFTGRGLGLAAVLGIVRGHKGALKVYSELGKGSSFKLMLPAVLHDSERAPVSRVNEPPLGLTGTFLVVDDDETVRAVTSRMLKHLGAEVLVAADGREALELYAAHRQDIVAVLMDLTMPHMDGQETFGALRRMNPNVRVLLMSGYNEHEAIARFVGKGLAGFIQKPFTKSELRERLRALVA